jgi:hypothetical protein
LIADSSSFGNSSRETRAPQRNILQPQQPAVFLVQRAFLHQQGGNYTGVAQRSLLVRKEDHHCLQLFTTGLQPLRSYFVDVKRAAEETLGVDSRAVRNEPGMEPLARSQAIKIWRNESLVRDFH